MISSDVLITDAGSYVVRRATRGDLPALVALLSADAIAAGRGDTSDDLRPYEEAFTQIDADVHQFLACLQASDGSLVGTLQITIIPGLSRRGTTRAQIEAVRVAEAFRGTGLGSRLLRWAIDHARQRGCGLVQLTTDASRTDAHAFYRRLGFEHSHHGLKLELHGPEPDGHS